MATAIPCCIFTFFLAKNNTTTEEISSILTDLDNMISPIIKSLQQSTISITMFSTLVKNEKSFLEIAKVLNLNISTKFQTIKEQYDVYIQTKNLLMYFMHFLDGKSVKFGKYFYRKFI